MSGESLTRLYYSLVRPQGPDETAALLRLFRECVVSLFHTPGASDWDRGGLLALVMQTRDLAGGKGEYGLFYLLMGELFLCTIGGGETSEKLQETMVKMMESLVHSPLLSSKNPRPYGSWKDFRACLTHIREIAGEEPLLGSLFFRGCIEAMVVQLVADLDDSAPQKSLFAKWAPRERNKMHGWLAPHLARTLAARRGECTEGNKCLARYRTHVSALNRALKTTETLQCEGAWGDIEFKLVPARAMLRKARSFLYPYWNQDPLSEPTTPAHLARVACRKKYLGYLRDCAQGTTPAKSEGLSPVDLVKEAISIADNVDLPAKEVELLESALNLQWWRDDSEGPPARGPVIPIVDTSSRMCMASDDPLCAAIGLGIRLAEASTLGRRLITYSEVPIWVNMEDSTTLTEAVRKVRDPASFGSTADLVGAMDLVANACVDAGLSAAEVAGLTVVVLSDSHSGSKPQQGIHPRIEALFRDAGKRSEYGAPYAPPHMVYWGLRTRQPLPCAVTQKGVTLLSGYHVPTVRALCGNQRDVGQGWPECPERALEKILAGGDRYTWLWAEAEEIPRADRNPGWLWGSG